MSNLGTLLAMLEVREDIEVVHIDQDDRIPNRHGGFDQWCEIYLAPTGIVYSLKGDSRYGGRLQLLLESLITSDLELSARETFYAITSDGTGGGERGLKIGSFSVDDVVGTRASVYTITDDQFGYEMDEETGTHTRDASCDLKRRTVVRLYPTKALAEKAAESGEHRHEVPLDVLEDALIEV